jgi:transposase
MEEHNLSEAVWSKLLLELQKLEGIYTGNGRKLRRFMEAVFWLMRTGAQWNELPSSYGRYRSVHKRFDAWSAKGIWNRLFERFACDHDGEWIMIDSTITRAHPCASGYEKDGNEKHGLGRSKGGFTCKIHALVDGLGNPLRFRLTGGQRHDITQAHALIEGIANAAVLGDKGYDAQHFIDRIEQQNCTPVIPSRSNRKNPRNYDEELYKERNLVERFFRKLKNYRRIFSRFDKKAANYLAFITFAATLILLA